MASLFFSLFRLLLLASTASSPDSASFLLLPLQPIAAAFALHRHCSPTLHLHSSSTLAFRKPDPTTISPRSLALHRKPLHGSTMTRDGFDDSDPNMGASSNTAPHKRRRFRQESSKRSRVSSFPNSTGASSTASDRALLSGRREQGACQGAKSTPRNALLVGTESVAQ